MYVYDDACIILLLHALPILYAGSIIWCPPFLNVEEGDSGSTITCNRSLASFQSIVRVSSEDGTANG